MRWSKRDQLSARQLRQRRNRLEVGVDAVQEVLGQAWGARCGVARCATLRAAAGRPGRGSAAAPIPAWAGSRRRAAGRSRHVRRRTMTTSLACQLRGSRAAREQHRLAHCVTQRRNPEVVLQLGQRFGERLGDGAWAHRRDPTERPGSRSSPAGTAAATAPHPYRRPTRRPAATRTLPRPATREPTAAAARPWGATAPVTCPSAAVCRRVSSTKRDPSTSPLTNGSGPPTTAETTRRSLRPVTGSTPNRTPPNAGSINGCTSTAIG